MAVRSGARDSMAGVGINVTSMFVRAEGDLGPGQVGRAVEDILRRRGTPLVDRLPLEVGQWDRDRRMFGIAVSPVIAGWMLVADTERNNPSCELAEQLATELALPVVVSSLYEICDPPEPQHNVVYGEAIDDDDWYPCLYELTAHTYRDLAEPEEAYQFFPSPPFNPREVVFLAFRGDTVRGHYRSWEVRPVATDDEPPF